MKWPLFRALRTAAFCGITFLSACNSFAQKGGDVLPGYGPLSAAAVQSLPPELAEISGMAYDAATGSLFAVTDEAGVLYCFPLSGDGKLERYNFGGPGDYEGLVCEKSMFYVLVSNGDIVRMSSSGGSLKNGLVSQRSTAPFGDGVEFETLYYDPARDALMLLCNACKDDKDKRIAAYSFTKLPAKHNATDFRLKTDGVKGLKKGERLRSSDAAIHPKTGELYILASINNLLVVADPATGAVKNGYRVAKDLYKQPEAIAFLPNGDLLISNEAATKGSATLLRLAYKP